MANASSLGNSVQRMLTQDVPTGKQNPREDRFYRKLGFEGCSISHLFLDPDLFSFGLLRREFAQLLAPAFVAEMFSEEP